MSQNPRGLKLVALDRFLCGTGVGEYHAGAIITDEDTWPDGMLVTRLERGTVAYMPADAAPMTEEELAAHADAEMLAALEADEAEAAETADTEKAAAKTASRK